MTHTKTIGERYAKQSWKDIEMRWATWHEFTAQQPCRFKSHNDCTMHAVLREDDEARKTLVLFKAFLAFKRLTK